MKQVFKAAAIVLALGLSAQAFSAQQSITVNATVDPTLAFTDASGQALPDAIDMTYIPGNGLQDKNLQTKIWSNDATKDINVSVASPLVLTNTSTSGTTPVDVSLFGKTLTATATSLKANELFPSGATDVGSIVLPLVFHSTATGALDAGTYTGQVSIVLTQDVSGG